MCSTIVALSQQRDFTNASSGCQTYVSHCNGMISVEIPPLFFLWANISTFYTKRKQICDGASIAPPETEDELAKGSYFT